MDGVDLTRKGALHLANDGAPPGEIGISTRIGLTKEADRLLRFYVKGNRFVSGPRRLNGYEDSPQRRRERRGCAEKKTGRSECKITC